MSQERDDYHHPSKTGIKSVIAGIITNLLLAIIKGTAGVLGNSYALVADAIESASDIFTSFIVLVGLKISGKAPDEEHPYGHGKAEPLAGMFVGVSLFIAAIVIAFQSIQNIRTPHEVPSSFTLWILLGVIIIKEFLYRFMVKVGSEIESTALIGDAWHHRSDAITSGTAFIGITIAIIGGPGYEGADDWAALIAAVIIIYNAYRIFLPALEEVMDKAPSPELFEEVSNIAQSVRGVESIHKLKIRKMGFEYFVDVHVRVSGDISVREGHKIAHQVKKEIRMKNKNIYDVLTHIEPS